MHWTPQPPPPPFPPPQLVYQTEPLFTVQRPPGPPPVEILLGGIVGFQKGYNAAHKAGCKQSRAASSDWWEEDDHGGSDGG